MVAVVAALNRLKASLPAASLGGLGGLAVTKITRFSGRYKNGLLTNAARPKQTGQRGFRRVLRAFRFLPQSYRNPSPLPPPLPLPRRGASHDESGATDVSFRPASAPPAATATRSTAARRDARKAPMALAYYSYLSVTSLLFAQPAKLAPPPFLGHVPARLRAHALGTQERCAALHASLHASARARPAAVACP